MWSVGSRHCIRSLDWLGSASWYWTLFFGWFMLFRLQLINRFFREPSQHQFPNQSFGTPCPSVKVLWDMTWHDLATSVTCLKFLWTSTGIHHVHVCTPVICIARIAEPLISLFRALDWETHTTKGHLLHRFSFAPESHLFRWRPSEVTACPVLCPCGWPWSPVL